MLRMNRYIGSKKPDENNFTQFPMTFMEQKDSPLVSVVIPVYNWALTVGNALLSAIGQDHSNMEVIVVNDGSTDNTTQVIEKLQTYDNRIKLISNSQNLWIAKSRNRWTDLAKWKYIAVLDADDMRIQQNKISKQINFLDMEANHNIGLLWTNGIIKHNYWKYSLTNMAETDDQIRKYLLSVCPFLHSTSMYRKSIWEEVWGYPEHWKYSDDLAFHLNVGNITQFANLPDYTILRDFDGKNFSHSHKNKQATEFLLLSILHRKEYPRSIQWITRRSCALMYKIFLDKLPLMRKICYSTFSNEKMLDMQEFHGSKHSLDTSK